MHRKAGNDRKQLTLVRRKAGNDRKQFTLNPVCTGKRAVTDAELVEILRSDFVDRKYLVTGKLTKEVKLEQKKWSICAEARYRCRLDCMDP